MPTQLAGSDYFRSIRPVFYHNLRTGDLSPIIGAGTLAFKYHSGAIATVRTKTQKFATLSNGTTQYFAKSSPVGLDFGSTVNFSLIAWAKCSGTGQQAVMSKGVLDGGNNTRVAWFFGFTTGSVVFQTQANNGTSASNYTSSYARNVDDAFHLLVATIDWSTRQQKLYVDGTLHGTTDITALGTLTNTGTFEIGRGGGNFFFLDGGFGEAQVVINKALTQKEVNHVKNYGIPDSWAGGSVISQWKFDSSDGTDLWANNSLTANGSPTYATGTYNQYQTFGSKAIRLWGNYIEETFPSVGSQGAVLLNYKPLFDYDDSGEQVLFSCAKDAANRLVVGYSPSDDAKRVILNGSVFLGNAVTNNESLQADFLEIFSFDFTNSVFQRFGTGELQSGSYSSFITTQFGSTFILGNCQSGTLSQIYDLYSLAIFASPLDRNRAINMTSGYKHAL